MEIKTNPYKVWYIETFTPEGEWSGPEIPFSEVVSDFFGDMRYDLLRTGSDCYGIYHYFRDSEGGRSFRIHGWNGMVHDGGKLIDVNGVDATIARMTANFSTSENDKY